MFLLLRVEELLGKLVEGFFRELLTGRAVEEAIEGTISKLLEALKGSRSSFLNDCSNSSFKKFLK